MKKTEWRIDGPHCAINAKVDEPQRQLHGVLDLHCVLDVAHVARGLAVSTIGTMNETVRLFELSELAPRSIDQVDHYVRQKDLIVRSHETPSHGLEALSVFRFCPDLGEQSIPSSLIWIECVLSIQTSTLAMKPIESVSFSFPQGAAVPSGTHVSVVVGEQNWLLCCHSTDFRDATVVEKDGLQVTFRLRANQMEKGVIRRFRFLVAVAPTVAAEHLAPLASAFESSKLPLST